jgi:hypothetical protein
MNQELSLFDLDSDSANGFHRDPLSVQASTPPKCTAGILSLQCFSSCSAAIRMA